MREWIVGLVLVVVTTVVLFMPGPGRRLRHWFAYQMTRSEWQKGRAVVALRVVDGSYEGLDPRWRVGSAIATRDRLEFTRFVGGMSFLKRPVAAVAVVSVGEVGRMSGYGRIRLDPDCQVVRLTTSSAVLEMAVWPPIPAEQVLVRMR